MTLAGDEHGGVGDGKPRDEAALRQAIGADPYSLELRLALVAALEESRQYPAAAAAAEDAARLAPENAAPVRALARLYKHLGRPENAASLLERLLELDPNDAAAWYEYAQLARYTYSLPIGTEDKAFARAAACAGNDWLMLELVAQYFLEQLKFAEAADIYGRLFASNPAAADNPVTCRDYARALQECSRAGEATKFTDIALQRCRAIAAVSAGEDREIIRREEAMLLRQAGRAEEELAVLRSIRHDAGAAGANYARPEYLPSTPDRLCRLRQIIAARDVVIFLQGPSFADFAERMGRLRGADFATVTLSSFPPVEKQLQRHLGRRADVLVITHPDFLSAWQSELLEFLTRPSRPMLLSTVYALSNLLKIGIAPGEFLARYDDRLLFAYPAGGPPLPSRPLHFEAGNSLSLLLPVLLMGRPKRVFLVGADGGAHPNMKRPYFYYDDIDTPGPEQGFLARPELLPFKNMPDRLTEANRRLQIDAVNCGRMLLSAFRFLEHLFDVPIPPIFTVCPHSAYRVFPRIDYDTAVSMLGGRPA